MVTRHRPKRLKSGRKRLAMRSGDGVRVDQRQGKLRDRSDADELSRILDSGGSKVAVLALVSSLFLAACVATYDTGGFPEGEFLPDGEIVGQWKSGNSSLTLEESGSFSSKSLILGYYNCASNGVREKTGKGEWATRKGRQRTEVLLKFDDGCSAKLWVGKNDTKVVLWGYGRHEEAMVLN